MVKRLGVPEKRTGGVITAQHVLRFTSIVVGIVGLTVLGLVYYRRAFAPREAPQATKPQPAEAKGASNDAIAGAIRVALADNGDNAAKRRDYVVDMAPSDVRRVPQGGLDAFLGPVLDGSTPAFLQFCKLLDKVEKHLPADDPEMTSAREVPLSRLDADPEKYRGLPVTVRGKIAFLRRKAMPDNPSGIKEVLEGELDVPGEGRCVFAASRVVALREGQEVVVHGLFMQMLTRRATGGGETRAPLVVTSHPLRVPAAEAAGGAASVMITIVSVLFVVYFVMMFMLRRKAQRRNPILEARRKVRGLVRPTPVADGDAPVDAEPPAAEAEPPAPDAQAIPPEEDAYKNDEHGPGQSG